MRLLLSLAALPFLTKIAVMFGGLTGYALQSLYKSVQLAVPVLWRRRAGKRGLAMLWPTDEPLPSLKLWMGATALSVGLSGAGILALTFALPFWHIDPQVIRQGFDQRFSVGPLAALSIVLFLSFVNSALEELHFRAWLDRELSRRTNDVVGIAVSAGLFGLMHSLIFYGLPGLPATLVALAVLGLVICGVCWSLLLRRPGGIHAAWWIHGLADALVLGWGLQWLGYF